MTLMSEVGQKAFDLGVPLAVHMDVTYRCNERCVHCYLDHDDHGEMTTAEIKDVLDQLAEAGVFFLTFSGGEVFMRRDFFELVEHARRLMFNVKIKTNAVMIHEKEARRIRELGVDTIQISVYSHRPEVHDAITKLPHSFDNFCLVNNFGIQHDIGSLVKGPSQLVKLCQPDERFGSLEERPSSPPQGHSAKNGRGSRSKVYNTGPRTQKCHCGTVGDPSSARRHHHSAAPGELQGKRLLERAKVRFALSREDFGDGRMLAVLDFRIEVNEGPAQQLCRRAPD